MWPISPDGLLIKLQLFARLNADVQCSSSTSHDRNSQSANPRRNLGAGAIHPVTEKAVRYFILTSRWTESARRGASHHDTSNDAISSNRSSEGQWRLSSVYRFYVRSPLTRDWIRDHYARSFPRNYERTIGGNFLTVCYRIILGCSMISDINGRWKFNQVSLDFVHGNDQITMFNVCYKHQDQ